MISHKISLLSLCCFVLPSMADTVSIPQKEIGRLFTSPLERATGEQEKLEIRQTLSKPSEYVEKTSKPTPHQPVDWFVMGYATLADSSTAVWLKHPVTRKTKLVKAEQDKADPHSNQMLIYVDGRRLSVRPGTYLSGQHMKGIKQYEVHGQ